MQICFLVVFILECPNLLATLTIETPANKSKEACVLLNRKLNTSKNTAPKKELEDIKDTALKN